MDENFPVNAYLCNEDRQVYCECFVIGQIITFVNGDYRAIKEGDIIA